MSLTVLITSEVLSNGLSSIADALEIFVTVGSVIIAAVKMSQSPNFLKKIEACTRHGLEGRGPINS